MIHPIALDIIDYFGIKTFVETGTKDGESAYFIKHTLPYEIKVITVDLNNGWSGETMGYYEQVQSDSVLYLQQNEFPEATLFYLDAHDYNVSPLHNELKVLLKRPKSIIMIDDFLVPFHWRHKFDLYYNQANCWYRIKYLFDGRKVRVMYPCHANRDGRGTGILFIGYDTLPALDYFEHRFNDYLWMYGIETAWKMWQMRKNISYSLGFQG
jgi:hypothetical protein